MTSATPLGDPRYCPLCRGIGWILSADPARMPIHLEVMACLAGGCPASGRPVSGLDQQSLGLPDRPRRYIWQQRTALGA